MATDDSTEDFPATQALSEFPATPPFNTRAWGRLYSVTPNYPHIELVENKILLGRRKICTIQYTDPRVSGYHCLIQRQTEKNSPTTHTDRINQGGKDVVMLKDLSTNGVVVNGKVIGKNNVCILKHSDRINLLPLPPQESIIYEYQRVDMNSFDTPGDVQFHYIIGEPIGTGSFSVVRSGIERTSSKKVAIKFIDKKKYWNNPKTKEQINREVDILFRVKHKNIINFYKFYESDRYICLVMELAAGGELLDRVITYGKFSETEAKTLSVQILNAISYLHSKGISHRDLKLENILLVKPYPDLRVKISDFGLAKIFGNSEIMKTLCGTPQYAAPEILSQCYGSIKRESNHNQKQINNSKDDDSCGYNKAVDMWAFGVILYILLSGNPPFSERQGIPLYEQIQNGIYHFSPAHFKNVSPKAFDLIRRLLQTDPEKRLTADQALQHPWIQETQSELDLNNETKSTNSKPNSLTTNIPSLPSPVPRIPPRIQTSQTNPKSSDSHTTTTSTPPPPTTTTTPSIENKAIEKDFVREKEEEMQKTIQKQKEIQQQIRKQKLREQREERKRIREMEKELEKKQESRNNDIPPSPLSTCESSDHTPFSDSSSTFNEISAPPAKRTRRTQRQTSDNTLDTSTSSLSGTSSSESSGRGRRSTRRK